MFALTAPRSPRIVESPSLESNSCAIIASLVGIGFTEGQPKFGSGRTMKKKGTNFILLCVYPDGWPASAGKA